MRLVTEDEARLAQIEHAQALTREIERLEQVARANRVAMEWLADQQERWRAERDAALAELAYLWRVIWWTVAILAVIVLGLLVALAMRR
jgi:lipopolysaccharide export LptBFGC system permease protein LptF